MPPRSTPPPKGSFYPSNDNATYRDLLLFEERLKTTAASLQRRKSRYQLFLFQLLLVIAFLLSEVLLPPQSSLLAIPYKMLLQHLLPDIYTPEVQVTVHPYFSSGLLFVSVTTLVLFFASGMYSEKIAYANKYVPHANRTLRSFNMYLNVRKPPLRSKLPLNPLAFFFPRPTEQVHPTRSHSPSPPTSPISPTSHFPPASTPRTSPQRRTRSPSPSAQSLPIPPIPPASNPRGELIFSSRVDKSFREAYERYRAAFERRREERERQARVEWWRSHFWPWRKPAAVVIATAGTAGGSPMVGGAPQMRTVSSFSGKGRVSRSGTPPTGAGVGAGGITMRQRERSGTPERGRRDVEGNGDMRTLALERSMTHVSIRSVTG